MISGFCSRYRAWAVYHLHTQSGQDQCIHQFFDRLSVSETDIIQYAAYISQCFFQQITYFLTDIFVCDQMRDLPVQNRNIFSKKI